MNNNETAIDEVVKKIYEVQNDFWETYYVEIANVEFLFREISRREYKLLLQSFQRTDDLEEAICATCVFVPQDYNFSECPAGIPPVLAETILEKSGFTGKEAEESFKEISDKFAKYSVELKTVEAQMAPIIVTAFPQYRLEEVAAWPISKTLWFLSRAEWVLDQVQGVHLNLFQMFHSQQPKERPRAFGQRAAANPFPPPTTTTNNIPTESGVELETGDISTFPELMAMERFMKTPPPGYQKKE